MLLHSIMLIVWKSIHLALTQFSPLWCLRMISVLWSGWMFLTWTVTVWQWGVAWDSDSTIIFLMMSCDFPQVRIRCCWGKMSSWAARWMFLITILIWFTSRPSETQRHEMQNQRGKYLKCEGLVGRRDHGSVVSAVGGQCWPCSVLL